VVGEEERERVLQLLLNHSKIVRCFGYVKFDNRVRWQVLHHDVKGNGILRSGEMAMSSAESVIVKNPNILSGTPVFRGTRVPLQLLFDSLERGHTLEQFLEGYPTVSREMAIAALHEARLLLSAKA
jgi:uncharacterized protein (DUF433 family)